MNNKFLIGIIAVLLVVVGVSFGTPSNLGATPGQDHYNVEQFFNTVYFRGATIISGLVTNSALVTNDAGAISSYTKSTTTASTAMVLTAADILNYTTILSTGTGGALTYTFPATSTVTAMIPVAGDRFEQCWYNAGANTLTFAAGAGFDLEVATSTSQTGAFDLTVGAGNMGCFTYMRKANTDIVAGFLEFSDAD